MPVVATYVLNVNFALDAIFEIISWRVIQGFGTRDGPIMIFIRFPISDFLIIENPISDFRFCQHQLKIHTKNCYHKQVALFVLSGTGVTLSLC